MIKQYKIQKSLSKSKCNNVYLCSNNNNLYIIKSKKSDLKLLLHEYNI
jgi:hypothetical protein